MGKFKTKTKEEKIKIITNISLMIFGNAMLAFGTAIFLTKLNIVAGGLSGIGIIIQNFMPVGVEIIDIVVYVLSAILWVVGFFKVGKRFALKTLASSFIYPLFLSLFLRVNAFQRLAESICTYGMSAGDATPIGNLLLCGLFGGVFIGAGVALNLIGGGSSGGVDVLIVLICKKINAKESTISFCLDALIIILGMIIVPSNIVPSLCGILSAFMSALLIEYLYMKNQSCYQVDIISDKLEDIKNYAMDNLGRGATIIKAEGGYKNENRPILRVVFPSYQYGRLRRYIYSVDKKAFITFTITNAVFGEGFKQNNKK